MNPPYYRKGVLGWDGKSFNSSTPDSMRDVDWIERERERIAENSRRKGPTLIQHLLMHYWFVRFISKTPLRRRIWRWLAQSGGLLSGDRKWYRAYKRGGEQS